MTLERRSAKPAASVWRIQFFGCGHAVVIAEVDDLADGLGQRPPAGLGVHSPARVKRRQGDLAGGVEAEWLPDVGGGGVLARVGPAVAHEHVGGRLGTDDGQDEGCLRIPGQRALGREDALPLPGAGEGGGDEVIVVIALPGGEAGAEPVVEAVAFENGGRLAAGGHVFDDLARDGFIVVGERVEVS